MIRTRHILLTIFTIAILAGCSLISNTFTYRDSTKEFTEHLLKEEYDSCIGMLATESTQNTDTLKMMLATFRKVVIENWGTNLEYTLMKSEKRYSSTPGNNTAPNTTEVLVEFNNKKELGVLKAVFDDTSKKILSIYTLDVKAPVPSMIWFWLVGLLALCVPAFNIYMIVQIRRSSLRKKWLKYIVIILLNVPAITYAAVQGFSFQLLNFQILFGISFRYMGYLGSYWTFGIPLGGIYWFWKLKQQRADALFMEQMAALHPQVETLPVNEEKPAAE